MPNINVSDKDVANIIIDCHKLMASSFTNLILESASDTVRRDATSMLQKTLSHQKQLFDVMTQKGWYQVQNASQQEIANAQQSVTSM